VFDPTYEEFTAEDLAITSSICEHLALHPFQTNYLAISELSFEKVKANLKEAVEFLRDEEMYGY